MTNLWKKYVPCGENGPPEVETAEFASAKYIFRTKDYMLFRTEDFEVRLQMNLRGLLDDKILTDLNLRVGGHDIPVHKNVIVAMCPYFRAMFTSQLAEVHKSEVELHGVDYNAVLQIIEYLYGGEMEITVDNVQNLLVASSLFNLLTCVRACERFMERHLDTQNCVGVYYFAHLHSCDDLKTKAMEFIQKNFIDVFKCEEFLNLTYEKVGEIIASDDLNVDSEEAVFEAIIQWVKLDEEMRKEHLGNLLPYIRLGLLSEDYIRKNISENRLVQSCDKCLDLLNCLRDFETDPKSYNGDFSFTVALRTGMIKPEQCLLLIGGSDHSKLNINCYNPLTRETYNMGSFPVKQKRFDVRDSACVVAGNNTLFVGGGSHVYSRHNSETSLSYDSDDDSDDDEEEKSVSKEFYMFDEDHNQWVQKASMLFPRSNFTLAYMDGKIYSFGGVTENQQPTEFVEVYDIEKNKWNYHGLLPTTLVDLTSVVFDSKVYLLGGRTGVGSNNVIVKYDKTQKSWTVLRGMPTPRFNCGACIVNAEIYVAGGQIYSHASHTITRETLRSVEIYNIDKNEWRQGPELPLEMYNVGLSIMNGALYACGTAESHKPTVGMYRHNVVCRLDLGPGQWELVELDLSENQGYCCATAKLHTRKLSQVFRPEVDT